MSAEMSLSMFRMLATGFALAISGVLVGAVAERFSRRSHPQARLRNIVAKVAIAYFSVSFILGHRMMGILPIRKNSDEASYDRVSAGMLMSLVMRIVVFVSGTVLGAALQPVGLTGGIATGKSTVSYLFQALRDDADTEFVIIDLDGIAHDILLPKKLAQNESVYDRLVSEFGSSILTKNEGANDSSPVIDRRKLGDLVFRDPQKRKKLNSITHPKIRKIMLKRIVIEGLRLNLSKSMVKRRVICVDIPLLFEGGLPMRILFGTIIVVACNSSLQLERLRQRNPDLTLEQCRQRIASQIPVEEKARKSHMVIRNDGSLKSLKNQALQVKREVGDIVAGQQRGIELSWLVIGLAVFLLRRQCNIN
jgi:dephospho-CoA kinase